MSQKSMYSVVTFLRSRNSQTLYLACSVQSYVLGRLAIMVGWRAKKVQFCRPVIKFGSYGVIYHGAICFVQVKLDVHYIISFFLNSVSSTCFGCYLHPSSGAQLQFDCN
jgi:hypothetical protein